MNKSLNTRKGGSERGHTVDERSTEKKYLNEKIRFKFAKQKMKIKQIKANKTQNMTEQKTPCLLHIVYSTKRMKGFDEITASVGWSNKAKRK